MDLVEVYRDIVARIIEEYASYKPSNGQIDTEAIIDRGKDHYEVMHVGWDDYRRIHGCVIHLDIIGGKIGFSTTAPIGPSRRDCWRRECRARTLSSASSRRASGSTPISPLAEPVLACP